MMKILIPYFGIELHSNYLEVTLTS